MAIAQANPGFAVLLEKAKQMAKGDRASSVWIARMKDGTQWPLVRTLKYGIKSYNEIVFDPSILGVYRVCVLERYPKLGDIASWYPVGREWQEHLDAGKPPDIIKAHVPPWGGFGRPRYNGEEKKRYAHTGSDIYAPEGTNLLAVEQGRVTAAVHDHPRAGNFLELQVNGENGIFYARYLHCLEIFENAGKEVARGWVIASVGMTGNANKAQPWVTKGNENLARTHVHLEIRELNPKGNPLDPIPLLEGKIGIPVDVSRMVEPPRG